MTIDYRMPANKNRTQFTGFTLKGMVTASSFSSGKHDLSKALDDNLSTCWEACGTSMPQWLQIDLGGLYSINKVQQSFAENDLWSFMIEGSVDAVEWAVLTDRTTGAAGKTFSESVSGIYRYIKLTVLKSASGYPASSAEFAITGSDAGINIAENRPVFSSSGLLRYSAEKAVDGNTSTYWRASNSSYPQWIMANLGSSCIITHVEQVFKSFDLWKFKIEGSDDKANWAMLLDKTAGERGHDFIHHVNAVCRYVRLTVTGSADGNAACSCEFKVYGFYGLTSDEEGKIYGIPVEKNLASGVPASTSSFEAGFNQERAVDDNESTCWKADSMAMPQWLMLDLGNICIINRIEQSFTCEDLWKFKIEGSKDRSDWVMLMDKTGEVSGKIFTQEVKAKCRYIRLTVTGSAGGNKACSRSLKVFGLGSPMKAKWWENQSGVIRYYVKPYHIALNSIVSQLDVLKSRGFEIIELMAPYEGPEDVWAGLGATNNYSIDPDIGTMEDFRNLISQCHARGMKVIFFGNAGYARDTAPFFLKACDDQRNHVYSKERMWFHFSSAGGNRWYWSDRANAYFYAYWGSNIPSYNFGAEEWRNECRNYLNFWAGTGVDGIGLDAPEVYDGISAAISRTYITDVLDAYGIWTNPEGARASEWIDKWQFKCLQDYSLGDWGANARSETLKAIKNQNPSGLNTILENYRDVMNALGGTTITPPGWECEASIRERQLEIAFQTTMGTMFTLHSGDMAFVGQDIIAAWPAEDQEKVFRLLRAQAGYRALAPLGLRVKLPTNDDNKYLAFKRTNREGDVKALAVLNFQNTAQTITVNLSNAGIGIPQIPIDLLKGSTASAITTSSFTITLQAYGYAVLGVN